jgi:uncharacterized membrane protein HdeD (DUF308 family)
MQPLHSMLLKRDWLYLQAILCLVIGILLWFYPDFILKATVILIGILLALYSIIAFIAVVKKDNNSAANQGIMISALISFIVGIILLVSPAFFVNLLIIIFGIILIGLAIWQVSEIRMLKRQIASFSALHYISPLIIMGIGLLVVIKPVRFAEIIMKLCAIGVFFVGISGLFFTSRLKKPSYLDDILPETNE